MSEDPNPKRLKTGEKAKTIGTHNGTFHCDEALAVYLLRQTQAYTGADVLRTRDQSLLDQCDIVVDVGGVYDVARQRFDHHQRGFTEVFGHGFITKLSSAGLVYKHFGREIVARALGTSSEDPHVGVLYLKMYQAFIESIDAIDNGIAQYAAEAGSARYSISTDLSSRVGHLNPAWNEPAAPGDVDARFQEASALAGGEFSSRLKYYVRAWLPGRDAVKTAFDGREGRIVVLSQYAPWKEHLTDLEGEAQLAKDGLPLYVVYPDEFGGTWRVQAVSVAEGSFENRKSLPEAWRGLRDDELSSASGIPGGVFVHISGFIGGNKTKDGAVEMARKAVVT